MGLISSSNPTAEMAKVNQSKLTDMVLTSKGRCDRQEALEFQKLPSGDLQIVYLGAAVAAQSAGATR